MNKVESILQKMQTDFQDCNRIAEESFASEVYLVRTKSGERILKLAHSELKYWRELKSLEFLDGHISVPKVLKSLNPEPSFNGAMLMNKLAGHPLKFEILNPTMTKSCGQLLAKLHTIPTAGLGYFQKEGFEKVPFENWWSYRKDTIFGPWTKAIENKMDAKVLDRILRIFSDYFDGFTESPNCYIHCDFRFGNILADNGNISGLIDFESALTGDPAYDFIKIHEAISNHSALWKSFLDGYSEIRPLPDLQKTIPYYELDLNYGFLQWAVLRKEDQLFQERLAKLLGLIDKR